MISRKLIAALVGLSLAGGMIADASAATPATIQTKPAAVQTATKVAPKVAVNAKHVRRLALKRHGVRLTRHAVKRMKVAKTTKTIKTAKIVNGRKLRLSHSIKRSSSKRV